jgi:TPP-dependent pyruvate/acetoin dehydrogenase alpha subunit
MEPDGVQLYRKMLICRRVEEAIAVLWHEGRISGEMHLGIGEEGINVGVLSHLKKGDAVALDHRCTAGMILRGVKITSIIKECLGRADGLCGGMGGHMHLFSKDHLAASSGIVGASGPAACGFALGAQHLRPGTIAFAFFGEGAMNQGMLLESMNLAAVWELPVLFVCRDNGMAITTPSASVTGGNLRDRVKGFGLPVTEIDGVDVEVVRRAAGPLIRRARKGRGPAFLRATCVRPEGHFLGDPLVRLVRDPVSEFKPKLGPLVSATTHARGAAMAQRMTSVGKIVSLMGRTARTQMVPGQDPLKRLRKRLAIPPDQLKSLETEVAETVRGAVREALNPETDTQVEGR